LVLLITTFATTPPPKTMIIAVPKNSAKNGLILSGFSYKPRTTIETGKALNAPNPTSGFAI